MVEWLTAFGTLGAVYLMWQGSRTKVAVVVKAKDDLPSQFVSVTFTNNMGRPITVTEVGLRLRHGGVFSRQRDIRLQMMRFAFAGVEQEAVEIPPGARKSAEAMLMPNQILAYLGCQPIGLYVVAGNKKVRQRGVDKSIERYWKRVTEAMERGALVTPTILTMLNLISQAGSSGTNSQELGAKMGITQEGVFEMLGEAGKDKLVSVGFVGEVKTSEGTLEHVDGISLTSRGREELSRWERDPEA